MSTYRKFTKVVCGVVLLPGLLLSLNAAGSQDEQILFLHLKITNGVVRLVDSNIVPGRLKPAVSAEKPGDLYLELISTNRLTVWTGVVPDPLVRRYEYEDPDHPGQLKVKEVKLDQADFTIRVPERGEARQLNIYRMDPSADKSATDVSGQARALLGTVELHVPEAIR